MDEPSRLMQVRDPAEGDEVCGVLRAAGIKCAVDSLPDANSVFSGMVGMPAPDALFVLVHESDLERAREALSSR